MTILLFLRNSWGGAAVPYRTHYINEAAIFTELESYVKSLTASGYFYEAFMTLGACEHLLEPTNRITCLDCIWEAIYSPDFHPAQYGLDMSTLDTLRIEIQLAIGIALCHKVLPIRYNEPVDWTASTGVRERLSTLMHGLISALPELPYDLMQAAPSQGLQPQKQHLDHQYLRIMSKIVNAGSKIGAPVLRSSDYTPSLTALKRWAEGIGYTRLAVDIDELSRRLKQESVLRQGESIGNLGSSISTPSFTVLERSSNADSLFPSWWTSTRSQMSRPARHSSRNRSEYSDPDHVEGQY